MNLYQVSVSVWAELGPAQSQLVSFQSDLSVPVILNWVESKMSLSNEILRIDSCRGNLMFRLFNFCETFQVEIFTLLVCEPFCLHQRKSSVSIFDPGCIHSVMENKIITIPLCTLPINYIHQAIHSLLYNKLQLGFVGKLVSTTRQVVT